MLMMDQAAEGNREELRRKLRENFDGRIVRKDLTKKIKEGANYRQPGCDDGKAPHGGGGAG